MQFHLLQAAFATVDVTRQRTHFSNAAVTRQIYTTLSPERQISVKNSYAEFHENTKIGSTADTT